MRKAVISPLLALLVLASVGCESRTYVLVTVDVDPALQGTVTQVRFVSRLMSNGVVRIAAMKYGTERAPAGRPYNMCKPHNSPSHVSVAT